MIKYHDISLNFRLIVSFYKEKGCNLIKESNMAVLWVEVPCGLVEVHRLIVQMMEATSASATSVNFYHTTRRYNPEDSYI
jgi:hypothetical protein